MSTKWLNKLTEEEFIKLHNYVFGEDVADSIKNLCIDPDENICDITFMEKGWITEDDNGKKIEEAIETNYTFDDFDGITIYDWVDTSNNPNYKKLFREWMIDRFGVEYLNELIQDTLELNLIDYLDWSKTEGWRNQNGN